MVNDAVFPTIPFDTAGRDRIIQIAGIIPLLTYICPIFCLQCEKEVFLYRDVTVLTGYLMSEFYTASCKSSINLVYPCESQSMLPRQGANKYNVV